MSATPKYALNIRQNYPELTGKYRNIADYILNQPEVVVGNKVREIAEACSCDDALIIRFCQKLGYKGFSDLKASIAAEFMPAGTIDLKPENETPFDKLKSNFLHNNNMALQDTVAQISEEGIGEAVRLIGGAEKVFLAGAGASGLVAMDLQVKLMRMGMNAVFQQDYNFAKVLLGLAKKNDVVLAISFSGENSQVCEFAEIARQQKASVIAITNFPKSSLAKGADVVLMTASDESQFRIGAMTSRIAQLLVVDFLVINLALANMDKTQENVLRTHKMIKGK